MLQPADSRRRTSLGALTFGVFCPERRQRDTEKPNTFGDGKQRLEQRVAELFKFAARCNRHLTGAASRNLPEVANLTLSVTVRPWVPERSQ